MSGRASRFRGALLASLLLLAGAAGCGGKKNEVDPIRIALDTDPATLDPALSVDVASGMLVPLVAQGLVRFGADLRLEPALAESWEVGEAGALYTFALRPGAKFADGTAVSAELVRASYERLLDPKTKSPRHWLIGRVAGAGEFRDGRSPHAAGIEVIDATHLAIRLEQPFAPFLSFLAMPQAAILPRSLLESTEPLGSRLAGIGPWTLASWSHDDRIEFAANPAFRDPPRWPALSVRILPSPAMQMNDFEAGRLDVVEVPPADLARVRAAPPVGARLEAVSELAVSYVGLANDRPPLSDPRVRRALNFAVRGEDLAAALDGGGVRSHGAIPPGLPGYDPQRRPFPYAPDSARALLREAGYGDGFDLTILYREGSRFARALVAIQADLAAAGVRAQIEPREWATLKQTIDNGKADAFLVDWYADYPDAENFLFPLFHSGNVGGGGNRARYGDPQVDRAIEEAQREMDSARREALYREIDARVFEDAPWIYLWHPVRHFLVSREIEGFTPHPLFYGNNFAGVARVAR